MGEPADHSGDHEEHWEHVGGEAHGFVNDSTVEIDVRVELSFNKVLVAEGNLFEFNGDLDQIFLSSHFEDFMSHSFDDLGSRIVTLVDSVAESIQQLLLVLA